MGSIASEPDALRFMIPAFLFALTVVVFFHELGHFLVARWCRVRVETFSIGFGAEIFGFYDSHGTRWRFAWIPLGGYVKFMGDEDAASRPDGESLHRMTPEERAGAFHLKPLWQRAAVVAAGPIASFLLGIVLIALTMVVYGQPLTMPRLGAIEPGSVAAEAGLKPRDTVTSVNGTPIEAFEDLRKLEANNPGRPLELGIRRGDESLQVSVTPRPREAAWGPWKSETGWLGISSYIPAKVKEVIPDTAAQKAGMKAGDLIVSVDGTPVESFHDVHRVIGESPGKKLALVVERGAGERVVIDATPDAIPASTPEGKATGRLGFQVDGSSTLLEARRYSNPIEGLRIGFQQTFFIVDQTISYIGKVFAGRESFDQVSSVFGIAYMAGEAASQGFSILLRLTAFLSISIGLFNLFPIPLLDGGHLLYYAIEGMRGRPLGERAQRTGFRIGIVIVLTLFAVASYNDIVRLGTVFGQWIN